MQKLMKINQDKKELDKEVRRVIKITKNLSLRSQTIKFVDAVANSTASNSVTFVKMSGISPGNTNGTRIGNKIHILELLYRATILLADTTNVVRLVAFKWNMNDNSDTPSAAEIFSQVSDPQSNIVPLKPSRFKILRDDVFNFDVAHVIRTHQVRLKLNYDMTFDPTTTGGIGQLYLAIFSDSGAVPNPAYDINYQLQYVDSD